MHKFLYFLAIILTVFSCDYTPKSMRSIEDLVPKNASIVLSINSLEGFQIAINNNTLTSKIGVFKSLKKALIPLDSLKSLSPLLVSVGKESTDAEITLHSKDTNLFAPIVPEMPNGLPSQATPAVPETVMSKVSF